MPAITTPLRDYQDQGVVWLTKSLAQHKAVLLADDAGLGKTLQALTAADKMGAKRILVICPAGARRVWQNEIGRWFPAWTSRVFLVEPDTHHEAVRWRLIDRSPLVLVVGYDTLSDTSSSVGPWLARLDAWDLLILDEAHYLKNLSNRTKAIYGWGGQGTGIQAHARRVVLLTGTPTPNHAGELYQHCRTFWPWALPGNKSQATFEEAFTRYNDGVFGRHVAGSKNQNILRQALEEVVLRRRKSEVLEELPDLQIQDMPLVPSPGFIDDLDQRMLCELDKALATASDDEVIKILRRPDASGVAALRHRLGLLKVQPTVTWVEERLASVGKLLIFAWHRDVILLLEKKLAEHGPVVITGETTPSNRDFAVRQFQTNAHTRVFIGQIQAAGTAITLTAASEVAIIEPSWVPGENHQAICRAHRLGQHDSVLASFLYIPDTLDQRIMKVFRRKAAEIAELQGDF